MAINRTDPTGQKANRKRTASRLIQRLRIARDKTIAEIKAIGRLRIRVNAPVIVYQYDLSGDDFAQLRLAIQSYLDNSLDVPTEDMPLDWWYKKEIELPYRQGALTAARDAQQQVNVVTAGSVVAAGVTPVLTERVLLSSKYLDGIRQAQVRNYDLIKTLSRDTAKQVYSLIEGDIQAGNALFKIVDHIKERFDVSYSNAKRIAATEVNRAYNDAALETVKAARDETGVELAVVHISSLLKTTRKDHAARHNKVYTPEQQLAWWNADANRINCHCTTRTMAMKDGEPVDGELFKKIKDMRPKKNG